MLPLLSLHAIAAQHGEGLHPVLLAYLKRLAAGHVELVAAESGREQEDRAAELTGDRVTREEAGSAKRTA
jgi:hypothetical protein